MNSLSDLRQEDLVLYEMHVRGFTHAMPDVKAAGGVPEWRDCDEMYPAINAGTYSCCSSAGAVAWPAFCMVLGTHFYLPKSVSTAGTYAGIVEKLPYLRRLGVNAIELLPVHEFNELEYYQVCVWPSS